MAEQPLSEDELAHIEASQKFLDTANALMEQGCKPEVMRSAVLSVACGLAIHHSGERVVSRELFLIAQSMAQHADVTDDAGEATRSAMRKAGLKLN